MARSGVRWIIEPFGPAQQTRGQGDGTLVIEDPLLARVVFGPGCQAAFGRRASSFAVRRISGGAGLKAWLVPAAEFERLGVGGAAGAGLSDQAGWSREAKAIVSPAASPVAMEQKSPERLRLRVHCSEPAVVILPITYCPGWRVSASAGGTGANGVRLRRGSNGWMLLSVARAGQWSIELRYAPTSFRIGLAISCAAVCLWSVLALLAVWPGKRRPAGD